MEFPRLERTMRELRLEEDAARKRLQKAWVQGLLIGAAIGFAITAIVLTEVFRHRVYDAAKLLRDRMSAPVVLKSEPGSTDGHGRREDALARTNTDGGDGKDAKDPRDGKDRKDVRDIKDARD